MTRTRGTGHIFRPSRNWAISYYDPVIYGARKEYGFRSREAAERRLQEVHDRRHVGRRVPPPPEGEEARILTWLPFSALNPAEAAGPIVYAWVRRDVVLYIGKSKHGLSRPFESQHGQLGKKLRPTDDVLVQVCRSPEEALKLETELLRAVSPPTNVR